MHIALCTVWSLSLPFFYATQQNMAENNIANSQKQVCIKEMWQEMTQKQKNNHHSTLCSVCTNDQTNKLLTFTVKRRFKRYEANGTRKQYIYHYIE